MNRTHFSVLLLRIVLGLVVGGDSLALIVHQLHSEAHPPLVLLAIAELLSAILLLIPATTRLGGISPIAVFALAAVFDVVHGEYSIGFLAVYVGGRVCHGW